MKTGTKFIAEFEGKRYEFVVVEHVNIGSGCLCRELSGALKGRLKGDWELNNIRELVG